MEASGFPASEMVRVSLFWQYFLITILAAGLPLLSLLVLHSRQIEEKELEVIEQWVVHDLEQAVPPEYLALTRDFSVLEEKARHYVSFCMLNDAGNPVRCFGEKRLFHFRPRKKGIVYRGVGELHIQVPLRSSSFNTSVSGYLYVIASTDSMDRLVQEIKRSMVVGAVQVLAVLLPIILLLSYASGQTLRKIAAVMYGTRERLKHGGQLDLSELIPISSSVAETQAIIANYNDLVKTLVRLQCQNQDLMEKQNRTAAVIAHEMKVPVSLIRGSVVELLGDLDLVRDVLGDTSIFDERLALIMEKADMLQSHIEAMVSLCQYGTMESRPVLMNVRQWARAMSDIGEWIARNNGNHLEYRYRCKKNTFQVDQCKLNQAVLAILWNAGKYTRNGVITLEIDCTESELVIEVADTGIGIPEEILERVFEPFIKYQNDSEERGLGVGLYIAKRCIETLGGKIEVRSVMGAGTRFTILVPPSRLHEAVDAHRKQVG